MTPAPDSPVNPFEKLSEPMRVATENRLRQVAARLKHTPELHGMLSYHMGWEGPGAGTRAQGKRVRPLLVTLTAGAAGGDWRVALPAAAAVELIHNFSLIHDDIQDNSPLRRGRPTVWKRWGVAQAINAGDVMFTLAHQTILELHPPLTPEVTLEAAGLLHESCLHLTRGQYLDLDYEGRGTLALEEYWPMVQGKTAALLATCTELGALTAGAASGTREAYRRFGEKLGLAFQVQDDLLGIWGDAGQTGKSNESDLLEGKKSLPVLFGLSREGVFAHRWRQGDIKPEEIPGLARQLAEEGAQDYAQRTADELTGQALQALQEAQPQGAHAQALFVLTDLLLQRDT